MAAIAVSWPLPMRAIGAQNLLTMPGGVTSSGYLHKKGGSQFSLMKWPLRFIIIHKGCVYYFKSSTSAAPQGAFSLNGYNRVLRAAEETTSSNVFPFKIVHFSKRHRTWYFSAASEDERRKWMRHLRKEINYYNDKRDSSLQSDDLDYGHLEEPLEISPTEDDPEADYMTQDEDSDGEDGSPTSAGRPMVPPPPYPPPPVPFQPSRETRLTKGPPPPLPPPFKKPPPSAKGPPPPLPYAPHLEKPDSHLSTRCPIGPVPPLPPPNSTKPMLGPFSTIPVCERKLNTSLVGNTMVTLPIVENLQKVILNTGNKALISSQHLGVKPTADHRPVSPHLSTAAHNRTAGQIPKPPLPTKPKPNRPSFQRASPDGQSFRSSIEEKPLKKREPGRICEDSDDDDYENVQLPPSVFLDTMETSNVERIFKEKYNFPQNGLYCIRKSGTGKTSQVLVVWDTGINKARNYRVFEEDQRVYLETDLTFPTLAAMVEYYHINPLPSSNNSLPNHSLCLHIPFGYIAPR